MPKGKGSILIATDDGDAQDTLVCCLREEGHECECVLNVEEAVSELASRPFDLVLAHIRMPGTPVDALLEQVQEYHADVVVVLITPLDSVEAAMELAAQGAYDYIVQPFDPVEVRLSTQRALEKRRLESQNREFQGYLAQMVEERAAATQRLLYGITQALIRLLELRVPLDAGHAMNVAEISRRIARGLKMTADGVHKVYLAALLHDVGMIPVSDFLLEKHGRLTAEEYRQIQEHTTLAEALLKPIVDDTEVLQYIRHHHERIDGTGYPDALRGNIIPLGARIIAVAEAFDSMIRRRPYRKALSREWAMAELQRNVDAQFDRRVVAAFMDLSDELDVFLRKPPDEES